jgi:hypothetical protein
MNKQPTPRRRTAARTLVIAITIAMTALGATLGAGHALATPDERVLERQGRIQRQTDEPSTAQESSQGPSTRFPRRFFQPEPQMRPERWVDTDQPPSPVPAPAGGPDGLAIGLAVVGVVLAGGAATGWRVRHRRPRPEPTG